MTPMIERLVGFDIDAKDHGDSCVSHAQFLGSFSSDNTSLATWLIIVLVRVVKYSKQMLIETQSVSYSLPACL
jgi:hypothetical protein